MLRRTPALAFLLLMLSQGCNPHPQPSPQLSPQLSPQHLPAKTPRSGYHYQSADTQALQDDAFANPGLLWVDRGEQLWQQPPNDNTLACSGCHTNVSSMAGVALRYPAFDPSTDQPINLEQRINRCREQQQGQLPYHYESEPLLALSALVAYQSRGMVTTAAGDARLQPFVQQGQDYFYQRRGQMNLACHHCHELNANRMLRGDRLSEGHSNGYPLYRLEWQTLGSLHRRLRFCNTGIRAEPAAFGAPEYVNLELFLQQRGQGLIFEAPAVRR